MMEIRPNMMDRMVAAVSPKRGLERLAARASYTAIAASESVSSGGRISGPGGYNGGRADRRQTRGWFGRPRSANRDYLPNAKTLIGRSRDAVMNMPLATAAIERNVTFTIGTGLMAIPEIDAELLGLAEEEAEKLTARIGRDYDNYLSSTDPDAERTATGYGLQEIVLRGVLESGDILGLRVWPDSQKNRKSFTAWKLVEADRVVSPMSHEDGTKGASGNIITAGVEVDDYGAPVRYHVLKQAPEFDRSGKLVDQSGSGTVPIDVWSDDTVLPSVLHVMNKRRADQARGVPMLAPVLEVLRQVSDLTEAELFAAVMTAMIAFIYKSPGAQALPEADYGNADGEGADEGLDDPQRPQNNLRMESGQIFEIDADGDVDMKSPGRPNPAFDPFFMGIVKQLAAAVETPVEVLILHFTSSYSASRAALEVFYLTVRRRRSWMISTWCQPGYEAWLYEQVARGRYVMPGFFDDEDIRAAWSNVQFRGDGKISLDPAREAKGLEIQEAHAWRTGREITAEMSGGDYDANVKRRIGEHERFVTGGLPIPNAKGGGAERQEEREDS